MLTMNSKSYLDFKQDYRKNNLVQAQKIAIFAASSYLLFALLDSYLATNVFNQLVKTRILFTTLLFAIISLTYIKGLIKHWQKLFSILVIAAGVGVILLSSYLPCPLKTLYSQGLLLIIFYGYTMNRLLLIPATFAGMSITIIYIISVYSSSEIEQSHVITSIFFQVAANIFGIFNIAYKQRLLFKEFTLKTRGLLQSKKMAQMNKDLIKFNKKLNDLASTDGLTGIANRRHFDETLDQFIHNTHREKTPLSLIMIDIDFFKNYNDYYGHVKGDQCLKQIAELLQESIAGTHGLAARFGGEEFTIILPNTDDKNALIIVKKIQSNLEQLKIQHHDSSVSPFVTASYGVASACVELRSLTAKKLVTYADTCLYKAKEKGRNKIITKSI